MNIYIYIVGEPPLKPEDVGISSMGSEWVQLIWSTTKQDNDIWEYYIEYKRYGEELFQTTDRIYQSVDSVVSSNDKQYSAIVTDLHPATRYNVQLVVKTDTGTNKSDITVFTTRATGIPYLY